jgi:CheY-like chemotaxis protein
MDLPRILVVEDNPFLQRTYRRLLRGSAEVTLFTSGEEALHFLREFGTDFIISDQNLAGRLRGTDIYRHVRENHPHLARKFLFITASGHEVHQIIGHEVPMIEKPGICGAIAVRVYEMLKQDEQQEERQ